MEDNERFYLVMAAAVVNLSVSARFVRPSSLFSVIVLYSSFYFVSLHDFRIIICFTVVFLMECEKTVKRNVKQ